MMNASCRSISVSSHYQRFTLSLIASVTLLLSAIWETSAQAQQTQSPGATNSRFSGAIRERLLQRFDANHDGRIDNSERARIQELRKLRQQESRSNSQQVRQRRSDPGATGLTANDQQKTLRVGQLDRTYVTHRPPGLKRTQLLPVVIVLHGGGGNAGNAALMSGMSAKGDEEGFMVVYPNGTGRTNGMFTWNSGNCCAYAMQNNIDDVGFIKQLIESLIENEGADPLRVFITGISNGGMMSFRLACELSNLIAAAAPVAGALNVECKPANPVAIVMFNGTADDHVLYEGGTPRKSFEPREDKPVFFAVDFWIKKNNCSTKPVRQVNQTGNVITETYKSQSTNADVVLCTIKGGTHSWPGGRKPRLQGDDPTTEVSATDMMWEFFKAHPKR